MDPTPERDPSPTAEPNQRSVRNRITAGVAVVAVAAVAAFGAIEATSSSDSTANAATATSPSTANAGGPGEHGGRGGSGRSGRFGRGTFGTIKSIDGSKFSVSGRGGDVVKVTTSDSTTVVTAKVGTLANVVVGDHVGVISSGTDDPAATQSVAQHIIDSADIAPPNRRGGPNGAPGGADKADKAGGVDRPDANEKSGPNGTPHARGGRGFDRVHGVVASIDGSTLTVTKDDGSTVTVTTTGATTVSLVKKAKVSDLAVGDRVMVRGKPGSKGSTVAASHITEGQPFGPRGGPNGGPPNGGPPNGGPAKPAANT